MSDAKRIWRHELKYLCHQRAMGLIEHRLSGVLARDGNTQGRAYTVSSLYFDDYLDTCARENEQGANLRSKYRIRMYDGAPNTLKLEKKVKKNGLCAKQSHPLTIEQYDLLVQGRPWGLLYAPAPGLLGEFSMAMLTRLYSPRAIVGYRRDAFVDEAFHVRVTLDRDITATGEPGAFLAPGAMRIPLLERDMALLEVKYDGVLPRHIRQVLEDGALHRTTFSKYYIARQALARFGR